MKFIVLIYFFFCVVFISSINAVNLQYVESYICKSEKKDSFPFISRVDTMRQHSTDLKKILIEYINQVDDISVINHISESKAISFLNRRFNPLIFNGKGYKILRKNISKGKNKLSQSMLTEPNTIYHIQYDYDLCGEKIILPEGCILKFEGGSFYNGTLCGNYTIISSLPYHILKNVKVEGTFNVEESYPEWLGAVGNGVHDDTEYLQQSLDYFSTVKLCPNKNYFINNTLYFAYRRSLIGCNSTTISANGDFVLFKVGYNTLINGFNISLKSPQTVVSITSEHIAKSYYAHDKSADAWKYRQDADIKISDLRIVSKSAEESAEDIYCFESLANGLGTGFWQLNVENIYIYGKYKFAIYLSNAKVSNYKFDTWQTDQVWKNIKIHQAKNAIYIGNKGDLSGKVGRNVGRILFDNVSMQYVKMCSEHFAVLEDCEHVTFDSCTPWDWPNTANEYVINPNRAKAIAILNSPLNSQSSNITLTEMPIAPNSVPYVTSAKDSPIKASYDLGYFKPDLNKRCTCDFIRSLPSGLYLIPSDSRYNHFFGINKESPANMGFGPNLLSLEHARNGMVLLTFYCTFFKGIQSFGYLIVSGNSKGELGNIIFTNPQVLAYDSIKQFRECSKNKKYVSGFVKDAYGVYKLFFKADTDIIVDAFGNSFVENLPSHKGTSAQRPKKVKAGFFYFDTTLNKPIWKKSDDSFDWVDAQGNIV